MDVCRFILLIPMALCSLAALAQETTAPQYRDEFAAAPARLLVLIDGQVINGDVTPRPDGYDIQVPGGRLFINSDRVRFAAASLPDAYVRMRESIPEFTPTNHLELARWCLANKLQSHARREVLNALYLDPNRDDAKRMLQALEQASEMTSKSDAGAGLTEYPSHDKMQRPAIETRSLAGLSRSIAHSFVRDVQPLLMNKCATSGCHGPGTRSQFQLTSTHRGSTPAIAESNLAAVLRQVDFTQPDASPLLEIGEQAHGRMTASVYRGRSGALQMKILRDWVQQAAHDIAPHAAAPANAQLANTTPPESGIRQVSADSATDSEINMRSQPANAIGNPHAKQLTTSDTDGSFIREARYANRHDAFSPDDFNLKYHGRTTRIFNDQSSNAPKQKSPETVTNTQFP